MSDTAIEWTDKVWNPVTGCSKVSQGCKFCYAKRLWKRVYPDREFEDVQCHEDRLDAPLHWRKPARVFVNSMSDLFHEKVPFEFIDRIFAVMALAKEHTFQILTKRPERMLEYCFPLQEREVTVSLAITRTPWWESPQASPCATGAIEDAIAAGPLPNVWLGVSVEDQKTADERIPLLLQTPAAMRWVSYEPALGPVNFTNLPVPREYETLSDAIIQPYRFNALTTADDEHFYNVHTALDWIVCGGESGPGARPMHPDWARSVRNQCQAAGVAFFFKQWGEWLPSTAKPIRGKHTGGGLYLLPNGRPGCQGDWWDGKASAVDKVGKRGAGRLLDGREWNEYPQVPERMAVAL